MSQITTLCNVSKDSSLLQHYSMSSCNTTNCGTTTTTTCPTSTCASSCKCCHVQNVTIDNQLCVGNETQLRTCTSDGGALIVQNGCCTQTSGVLAHICGELVISFGTNDYDSNKHGFPAHRGIHPQPHVRVSGMMLDIQTEAVDALFPDPLNFLYFYDILRLGCGGEGLAKLSFDLLAGIDAK